jgi:hypothetical protein
MSATYAEAVDDMYRQVLAAWAPTGYKADWPNVAGFVPPEDEYWIRVAARHAPSATRAFGRNPGMYGRAGTLWVQLFAPVGQGLAGAYAHAKMISDALEGVSTAHCVWFRNVRVQEVGASGVWSQINILADFTYDEIK